MLPGQERVQGERRHDDEVVQHGGEGREEKAPVRVQDAGRHRAEAVQQDLQREKPEKQDGEPRLLPRLAGGEVLRTAPIGRQLDDRARKDRAEDGDEGEEGDDEREEGVGQAAGVLLAVAGEALDEEGDEDRGEHAAHKQLVDLVRQRVREGVGAGDEAGPEGRRLCQGTSEAGDPREHRRRRHREHRPQDRRHARMLTIRATGYQQGKRRR